MNTFVIIQVFTGIISRQSRPTRGAGKYSYSSITWNVFHIQFRCAQMIITIYLTYKILVRIFHLVGEKKIKEHPNPHISLDIINQVCTFFPLSYGPLSFSSVSHSWSFHDRTHSTTRYGEDLVGRCFVRNNPFGNTTAYGYIFFFP